MDFCHELCPAIAYICILYKDTFSVYCILYIVFCIHIWGVLCPTLPILRPTSLLKIYQSPKSSTFRRSGTIPSTGVGLHCGTKSVPPQAAEHPYVSKNDFSIDKFPTTPNPNKNFSLQNNISNKLKSKYIPHT